ncbi:MAG: hypothetical protein WC600_09145 [Desulfobaccales bacterium]
MKAFFLALLVTIAFTIISCATTPPQEETANQQKWQQEMEVILPRGGAR